MAVTRLERKGKRNKSRAKNRVSKIKLLNSVPVIKNVDIEEMKKSFETPSKPAKKAAPAKEVAKVEEVAPKEVPAKEEKVVKAKKEVAEKKPAAKKSAAAKKPVAKKEEAADTKKEEK